jgi:VWFA-related protein
VVTDDGEPREIVGFRVIDLSEGAGAAPSGASSEQAPGAAPTETEGRRILVLFDMMFSTPHHLRRALSGIEQMVAEDLHPADRVAVAYLTVSGARLVLGFTRDRGAIDAALGAVGALLEGKRAQMQEALGRVARAETSSNRTNAGLLSERLGPVAGVAVLRGLDPVTDGPTLSLPYGAGNALAGASVGDGDLQVDPVAGSVSQNDPFAIGRSLAAGAYTSAIRAHAIEMQRLLTTLRGVPSPKLVLFLSEGFGTEALRSFGSQERAPILSALDDTAEVLRRAGWTLHAIDAAGIPDPFSGEGFTADSLLRLADKSGGFLFENYNEIGVAAAKLARRTSVTYMLTIRAEDVAANGRPHALDVRLRDGLAPAKLSHRLAYYAPKPVEERTSLERQLDSVELLLGAEEIHQLDGRVLVRSLPLAGGLAAVPVVIELPADTLQALLEEPNPGRRIGLDLQAYAVDSDGAVQDLWLRKLGFDLHRREVTELLTRGGLRVLGGLALPAGDYRIRVMVRASPGERVSLTTTPVTVAAPAATDGPLLAMDPVLVDRSGSWLELSSVPPNAAATAGRLLAFDQDGERPLVPAVEPSVGLGDELDLVVIASADGPAELSARVVSADGDARRSAPPIRLVERAVAGGGGSADPGAGLSRYLARFSTAGLAPGRYGLEVRAWGGGARGELDGSPEGGELRTLFFDVRDR